jgi:hypothetical protein
MMKTVRTADVRREFHRVIIQRDVLEHPENIMDGDIDSNSLLSVAIKNRRLEILSWLLKHDGGPTLQEDPLIWQLISVASARH